jgi:predicted amidophosphoribosyltransferase
MVDRDNAVAYVAAIINRHLPRIRQRLGIATSNAVLVPVPSSTVVKETLESDRFPALKLARAYEAIGLGECVVAVMNRAVARGKTTGAKRTADEILANLVAVNRVPDDRAIVLIDDLATSGASFAAMDRLLGTPAKICALAVGLTDRNATDDAYTPRSFVVSYNEDAPTIAESLKISRRPTRS